MENLPIQWLRNIGFNLVGNSSVRWRTNGINPACAEHDTYLTIFQEAVMSVLQARINESIEQKPEVNARNKAIQVNSF